jgi:hypothetical protein
MRSEPLARLEKFRNYSAKSVTAEEKAKWPQSVPTQSLPLKNDGFVILRTATHISKNHDDSKESILTFLFEENYQNLWFY